VGRWARAEETGREECTLYETKEKIGAVLFNFYFLPWIKIIWVTGVNRPDGWMVNRPDGCPSAKRTVFSQDKRRISDV